MARLLLAVIFLVGGIVAGGKVWLEFLDLSSLLITGGGTFVVTLLTFSWARLEELGRALLDLFATGRQTAKEQIAELRRLTHLYHLEGLKGLEKQEESIGDLFLRQGIKMLVDLQREEHIRESLENEFFTVCSRYESARQILLTVGKLLPAFGFIGTLIGLVLLLRQIPNLDLHTLPSALSVAVLTTLYGTLLANLVVLPLAAKLQSFAHEREAIMRLVLEGIVLLARGESPALIERKLSTLLPSPWYEPSADRARDNDYRSTFVPQKPTWRAATR
jgi:chemotaxis protein MotA